LHLSVPRVSAHRSSCLGRLMARLHSLNGGFSLTGMIAPYMDTRMAAACRGRVGRLFVGHHLEGHGGPLWGAKTVSSSDLASGLVRRYGATVLEHLVLGNGMTARRSQPRPRLESRRRSQLGGLPSAAARHRAFISLQTKSSAPSPRRNSRPRISVSRNRSDPCPWSDVVVGRG